MYEEAVVTACWGYIMRRCLPLTIFYGGGPNFTRSTPLSMARITAPRNPATCRASCGVSL